MFGNSNKATIIVRQHTKLVPFVGFLCPLTKRYSVTFNCCTRNAACNNTSFDYLYLISGNDNSPEKRNIIEVKTSKTKDDLQSMNQAIAQTIVFSFLQKKALPNLSFIPNILISPNEFRIIMYDVDNDILLCSEPLAIFCKREFKKSSIIMLWMVLHYELFLEDVKPRFEEDGLDMRKFNAKFKKRAKDKIDVYLNDLEFATRNIQSKSKECFPSSAELSDGEDVFS